MSFTTVVILFVAAISLHNLEEAIWLPRWSRQAGRWHAPVMECEFRFAVIVLTLLAAASAALALMQGPQSLGAYILSGYALAMGLNVFIPHVSATIIMRRYMPGTATAVLLNLPVCAALIGAAVREGQIDLDRFLWIGPLVVVGIVALIPVLFGTGRRICAHRNLKRDKAPTGH